ncbi:MAG TPA: altronate dehydratase family protein [Pyrinomonadaceae bacterium]|jgi:altronate hydrolase|nr:altronate dehydratase family protein [Pyrinomonadaceae bacterium]
MLETYIETGTETAGPVSDYAIIVNPDDNVAVVKSETSEGLALTLPFGDTVVVNKVIPPGHRFATQDIPAGEFVRQYGQPIGTSLGIGKGDWVTHDNMTDEVPVVRDLADELHTPAPDYFAPDQIETFMGFRRPDGRVGTRNYVLIVPTSMCASHEATQISMMSEFMQYSREKFPNVDGVVAIPHNKGCGCQDGSTLDVMMRTLANYADHPNVGGVILIDLGCEKTNLSFVEKYLTKREKPIEKPVFKIGIQDVGGTQAAIEIGLKEVEKMLPEVNKCVREEFPVSELVLGVKCGSSDGFSGISANPSLGYCSDLLVRSGGTVLLTEVPEFCGAEHILANRAKDSATGRKIYALVDWYKDYASKFGGVLGQNPSTGNKAGGLLNITIKSLGAIVKAGTTRIEDCVEYAETPRVRGINLMQGPGYDQESTPGLVAAGATAIIFTTGNGTTIGNAIAPVIKLASNNKVFEKMSQDLDISAGNVIEGTESISEVGTRLFEHLRRVASGEIAAKAEILKHREFQFWAEQTVSL